MPYNKRAQVGPYQSAPPVDAPEVAEDRDIRLLVQRLSRLQPSGERVIERASIMASGGDPAAVVAWITAHHGEPETTVPGRATGGLHGGRAAAVAPAVRRYVLPAGVFA